MSDARIIRYKLPPDKTYVMTKLLEDGRTKLITTGEPWMEIEVGQPCLLGNWYTTPVQDIQLTGKGVIIETMNSTYLIEEFAFTDIVNPEDKYKE